MRPGKTWVSFYEAFLLHKNNMQSSIFRQCARIVCSSHLNVRHFYMVYEDCFRRRTFHVPKLQCKFARTKSQFSTAFDLTYERFDFRKSSIKNVFLEIACTVSI